MSVWIRAVCKKSLSSVTPELLVGAITSRLPALVTRYPPTDDSPLREVLTRLRIESQDEHPFAVWDIHFSESSRRVLRLTRWVGREFEQERRDLFDQVVGREDAAADRVRALLTDARECVGIEVPEGESSGMGWPVAMSAAAALALAGDGMIRADVEGWLEPNGKDVAAVLSEMESAGKANA